MPDLYLAGNRGNAVDFFLRKDEYVLGYNRLFSYGYQKNLVERVIAYEEYLCGNNYPFNWVYMNGLEVADRPEWWPFMREMCLNIAGDDAPIPQHLLDQYKILSKYPSMPTGVGRMKRGAYMDLFLVGPEKDVIMQEVTETTPSNMLFNFVDGKRATDRYMQVIKPKKLFIDSGAFSAWTKGKSVDLDQYIDWINTRADYIDLYGQIDVIPGDIRNGATTQQVEDAAKATWQNYLEMRPRMKNPEGLLYTFHVGEPYAYLRQALEWRDDQGKPIPYMALGGMVGKPMPLKWSFLDTCFKIIKESSNPNIKIHAFGMTSLDILEAYPITSADSTSWIMTGANGNIMTDFGIIAVSDQMSRFPEHYSHLKPELQNQFEASLSEFGFSLEDLRHSRDHRIMFNARYMNKKISKLQYHPGPKRKPLF